MKKFKVHNLPESIFSCLKEDHKNIKKLCKDIVEGQSGQTKTAKAKFEDLKVLLLSHAKAEEIIFYSTLKRMAFSEKNKELNELILEAIEEHHVADLLVKELSHLDPSDERWIAKMTVLSEALDHHIKEEEHEMFSDAKEEFDRTQIKNLGASFLDKQTDISHELKSKITGISSR